jgi:S1-C subfamily serine protease
MATRWSHARCPEPKLARIALQSDLVEVYRRNSGGPLFIRDQVVGVNTVKFKGAEGIGFAIHYSEVMRVLSQ